MAAFPSPSALGTRRPGIDNQPSDGEMSAFAAGLLARPLFKNYDLGKCLASSERKAVFRARDPVMDRNVVITILRPWPGRPGAVEEFFSLAGSIARLRTTAAARGYDAGRVEGNFYIVHEYLAGESLADRLARRQTPKLTERESLKLVLETARSLRELFDRGNPHGNLRPSTLLQQEGGKVMFTGIGIAWTVAWPSDTAAFAANPNFLPPERIAGDLNIDIRGDLYSLGAIWYLTLIGEPVFAGAAGEEILRRHQEEEPTPVRTRDPRLSAATSTLIQWLLGKNREARPRTPRDFLRKLKNHPLMSVVEKEDGAEKEETPAEPAGNVDDRAVNGVLESEDQEV